LTFAKPAIERCLQGLDAKSIALYPVARASDATQLRQVLSQTALQAWAELRQAPTHIKMESS